MTGNVQSPGCMKNTVNNVTVMAKNHRIAVPTATRYLSIHANALRMLAQTPSRSATTYALSPTRGNVT